MGLVGYVRISHSSQDETRQIKSLEEYGVPREKIYIEKQSGKDFNRPVYQKMKSNLKPTDRVVIDSLSRLGRNRLSVVEEYEDINKICSGIVVLSTPILSTGIHSDNSIGELITKIFLEVIAWSDEADRIEKKRMQMQGIREAQANNRYTGRKRTYTLDHPKIVHAIKLAETKEYSRQQIADIVGISPATFYKLLKEHKEKQASKNKSS